MTSDAAESRLVQAVCGTAAFVGNGNCGVVTTTY